jgi:phosphoglycolate phosphatase
MMKSYKYILFDLDGTIIDSSEGIVSSFIYALSKFGIEEKPGEHMRRIIGPPLSHSFKTYYGFNDEDTALGVKYYREVFKAGLMLKNTLYPGITELIDALKAADKKVIIATSKPEIFVRPILEDLGILDKFDFIAGSIVGDIRVDKGEIINYIIEEMQISDRTECVMIGDRDRDITGAFDVGIDCIGVLHGFGSLEELEKVGCKVIAKDSFELRNILL